MMIYMVSNGQLCEILEAVEDNIHSILYWQKQRSPPLASVSLTIDIVQLHS